MVHCISHYDILNVIFVLSGSKQSILTNSTDDCNTTYFVNMQKQFYLALRIQYLWMLRYLGKNIVSLEEGTFVILRWLQGNIKNFVIRYIIYYYLY